MHPKIPTFYMSTWLDVQFFVLPLTVMSIFVIKCVVSVTLLNSMPINF